MRKRILSVMVVASVMFSTIITQYNTKAETLEVESYNTSLENASGEIGASIIESSIEELSIEESESIFTEEIVVSNEEILSSEESIENELQPSVVTGVQAGYDSVNKQVVVTWNDNGAEMYKVVRTDGINGYTSLTYRATADGWVDNVGLVEAQLYYYRVAGYFRDTDGNLVMGSLSDAAAVVAISGKPGKVENVTAEVYEDAVALTWDNTENARYYKVCRADGATGQYSALQYNIDDTEYVDTSVEAGTYRYKVVGYYKDIDRQWVYGDLSDTIYATVEKNKLSAVSMEEAKKYAIEKAPEHISTYLGLTTAGYAELDSSKEFYLGDGYYTYTYNEGILTKNSVICFPIIQDDTVVIELYVDYIENHWTCSGSTKLVEALNENFNNVYAIVSCNDETYIVTGDRVVCNRDFTKELDYDVVVSQLSQLEVNAIDAYNEVNDGNVNLGYIENPLGEVMSLGYTPGFNINEVNYKVLEMAYCLVDQNGPDGKLADLCWASSAVTIIRYRSGGYRTLQPYFIASVLGKTYDEGGRMEDVLAAMKKYLSVDGLNHYNAHARAASGIVEVQHNINNGFPISMGCATLDLVNFNAHIVTVVGYNNNMLIYWDPVALTLDTAEYTRWGVYPKFQNRTYKWETSVMIPLS